MFDWLRHLWARDTIQKFKIGDKVYMKELIGFSQMKPTGGEWIIRDITLNGYKIHQGCSTPVFCVWDRDLVGVEEYQSLTSSPIYTINTKDGKPNKEETTLSDT